MRAAILLAVSYARIAFIMSCACGKSEMDEEAAKGEQCRRCCRYALHCNDLRVHTRREQAVSAQQAPALQVVGASDHPGLRCCLGLKDLSSSQHFLISCRLCRIIGFKHLAHLILYSMTNHPCTVPTFDPQIAAKLRLQRCRTSVHDPSCLHE